MQRTQRTLRRSGIYSQLTFPTERDGRPRVRTWANAEWHAVPQDFPEGPLRKPARQADLAKDQTHGPAQVERLSEQMEAPDGKGHIGDGREGTHAGARHKEDEEKHD